MNTQDNIYYIVKLLLNRNPEISRKISGKGGENYEYGVGAKRIYFLTEEGLKELLADSDIEYVEAEKACIKISENIFKNNCRYILFVNRNIKEKSTLSHYDYTNYEFSEICRKIEEKRILNDLNKKGKRPEMNDIRVRVENIKYTSVPINGENSLLKKKIFDMSVLDYVERDEVRLRELLEYMGYSEEHKQKILNQTAGYTEQVRYYYTVAMRFLDDKNPDINLTGKNILRNLLYPYVNE